MKKITSHLSTWLIISSLLLLPLSVFANELNAPQKVIKDLSDQIYQQLNDNKEELLNERQNIFTLVDTVIEPRLDVNKISRLVLGKYWRTATEEQKEQFQKEFKALLINTYATAFNEFTEWTIHFTPMKLPSEKKRVIVKSEIIQPSKPPVAVNYRMSLNQEGEWKAYDVIIEGISMVTNYKGSFASSIKESGGLDNVIRDLVAKNKKSLEEIVTPESSNSQNNTQAS